MSITDPHFAWPLRFDQQPDGTVGFAVVQQGTNQELQASAAVIVSTPRKHRDDDPTFGVTPLPFQQGGIDTDRLAAEIQQSDPRLSVEAEDVVQLISPWLSVVHAQVDGTPDQEG